MEADLEAVVTLLARNRWPFRLHATYDETISRALDVFEKVNREVPIGDLRWFFDHCETISDRNIERVKALGGGIAVQHRMAFQGEYFVDRYGKQAAERTPPVRRMLEMGVPGRHGHRRDPRRELQPVDLPLVARHGQDRRRHGALPGEQPALAARRRSGGSRSEARGSAARRTRRGRSRPASTPISPS